VPAPPTPFALRSPRDGAQSPNGAADGATRDAIRTANVATDLDPESLYQRVAPVIYTRCLRLLGNDQDALDATHDIFVRLLSGRLGSFRAEAKLSTWVYSVATRHCLDRLRSWRRKRKFLERVGALLSLQPQAPPQSGQAEARVLLEKLSGQLRPRPLQIAVHLYLDEMSQSEVAELMGISERAVRKAMTKIRKDAFAALSGVTQPTARQEESDAH
jgi:RNA polymerase sigma-70 factor, ECF subfamily